MSTLASLLLAVALILYPFRNEGGTAPGGLAAPTATTAWLRLDRVDYATTDCLTAVLNAPGLSVPPGVAPPALRLGTRYSGDHETILMSETAPGVFVMPACIPLGTDAASAGDGVLQAQAGDQIGAAAEYLSAPLAMDTAVVHGGNATGAFSYSVDPGIAPPQADPPVAAVVGSDGVRADFIENQVIVQEQAPGDLAAFLARRGGTVLETLTLSETAISPAVVYDLVQVDPPASTQPISATWARQWPMPPASSPIRRKMPCVS